MTERSSRRGALLAVVTTVSNRRQARALARELIERRLAACVHLWPIESCYRWQERVQQDREYRLVCKTTAAGYAALAEAIGALHPYELPALYALPLTRASPAYAGWIEQACATPRASREKRRR